VTKAKKKMKQQIVKLMDNILGDFQVRKYQRYPTAYGTSRAARRYTRAKGRLGGVKISDLVDSFQESSLLRKRAL
jgi:hypothetical protein